MEKYYSAEQASQEAIKWCEKHPGWKRICDINDPIKLYKTWEELPKYIRRLWKRDFRSSAKAMWEEYGNAICKVSFGFISGEGKYYRRCIDIPHGYNFMMGFKVF